MTPSPLTGTRRDVIIGMARKLALPAVYSFGSYSASGGLVSYGIDQLELVRERGVLCGSHSARGKRGRASGATADQVPAGESISRPPRRSASTFRRRCSPAPTR